MKNLSEPEFKEIEKRCEATSLGPWVSFVEGRDFDSGSSVVRTGGEDFYLSGATIADQDFIAHAKQDIPRLIAVIRSLRGDRKAVE